jgi:hypothetical protein
VYSHKQHKLPYCVIKFVGSVAIQNEMGAEEERTRGSRIAFLDVYVAFYNIHLVV